MFNSRIVIFRFSTKGEWKGGGGGGGVELEHKELLQAGISEFRSQAYPSFSSQEESYMWKGDILVGGCKDVLVKRSGHMH